MKIATPAIVNDVVWSFATSAFAAILGHIGDDMVAANAVAVMVVNIGAIACRGFANATTIIVSQELGKDNIDAAREYGKRMLRITMVGRMRHNSGTSSFDSGFLPGQTYRDCHLLSWHFYNYDNLASCRRRHQYLSYLRLLQRWW